MPEVIFGMIAVVSVAAFIREFTLRKRAQKDAKPTPQDRLQYETIGKLTEKSNRLVTQAETDAQKLVTDAKNFSTQSTQNLGQELNKFLQYEENQTTQSQAQVAQNIKTKQEEFEKFITHLTQVLDSKTDSSVKQFSLFLQTLAQEAQKSQATNWEGAKQRVNELFESFETKLADFLLQTEQKMMLSVDLELKSARQLIDTYKVQQMNIIDENIVAMLEKTLSLVLAKNLTLKDQMDLVYESLEKAKTESFLV